MADAITTKNITSVDEVQSVDNTDKVFVNDNGSFKQISVSNLMKQAPSGVTEETDPTVSEWAKQPTKPSYTANEVGALPVGTKIPTKTSDLTNDSGYLTQIPEEYVTETELGQKGYVIEDDIPEKLPSPGILTFTGAVNDTYDGSADKTINIPTGGGEGGTSDYNALANKPKLNGVEIAGNKTSADYKIVSSEQGIENNGKFLGIGADGNVTPVDKPTYTADEVGARPDTWTPSAEDVGALPNNTEIPSKTSDLENDNGFVTNSDIPEKLPNPQKIIFAGAVSAEYDGSSQQTINIPTGGGSDPYTLPIMSETQLGGGKAVSKTDEDVPVAVDPLTGQLFVPTYPENTGGGGGTVDPEQIKQAVNGYLEEHPVSGMTAEQEQQLDKNTEDISSLSEGLVDVDFKAYNDSGATIKSGTYMNSSTDGLAGSAYCTTDFVKIPSFAKTVSVILSEALTKSDNATMKVYDESENALASKYLGTGATKCTIDLPEGAKYWRVSVASTATTVQVNYIKDTNGVIPLAEDISANKEAIYDINNPFLSFSKKDVQYPTNALWDNRSASVGSTLPAEFSLPLNQAVQYFAHRQRVYTGERIEFDSANPPVDTTINEGMVVTDDNFVVLEKISYETIRYSGYEFAQDGYFYVSYGITDETHPLFRIRKHLNFYEMGSTIDNAKKELPAVVQEQLSTVPVDLLTEEYLLDAVSSVICIGDSVTEGVTTGTSGIRRDLSYPARLSKMTGWTIENAGAAGLTTLQWWQNKFSSYTYSDYQTAIIELGYNGGLTDTIDSDTAGDHYEQYADTNTGAYCKIVEGVKAQNSNIFIILIISPGFSTTVANVVIKISEKYSLPYIDLRDVSYVNLQDDKYHGKLSNENMDYTHMNAIGYLAKAEFIRTALVKIFAENISAINSLAIAWES